MWLIKSAPAVICRNISSLKVMPISDHIPWGDNFPISSNRVFVFYFGIFHLKYFVYCVYTYQSVPVVRLPYVFQLSECSSCLCLSWSVSAVSIPVVWTQSVSTRSLCQAARGTLCGIYRSGCFAGTWETAVAIIMLWQRRNCSRRQKCCTRLPDTATTIDGTASGRTASQWGGGIRDCMHANTHCPAVCRQPRCRNGWGTLVSSPWLLG